MIASYLARFAKLNANKNPRFWTEATTHRAPHKPLLLLAVLDLFAQGSIQNNFIDITAELLELFALYWHKARPPSQRGYITYPFYYLQSDGFWHLLPKAGQEAALQAYRPNAGLATLQALILGAKLDDDLYDLLCVEESRNMLQAVLLETYFAPELGQILLAESAINAEAYQYSQALLEKAHGRSVKESGAADAEYRPAVRDQGFRRAIVKAYDHRCAICGVRILTAEGHTAVAAAHIIPWRHSYNDDPRNGLALCHLCHWSFDEGLISFSDNYRAKISPQLAAVPNLPGHLLTFTGRQLIGPEDDALWPFADSIRWHRQEVFRTR